MLFIFPGAVARFKFYNLRKKERERERERIDAASRKIANFILRRSIGKNFSSYLNRDNFMKGTSSLRWLAKSKPDSLCEQLKNSKLRNGELYKCLLLIYLEKDTLCNWEKQAEHLQ